MTYHAPIHVMNGVKSAFNGHIPTAIQTGIVEYPVKHGIVLQVIPLTSIPYQSILRRAKEHYPDPDAKPYEVPIPDSIVPDAVFPATDNPEYLTAYLQTAARRNFDEQCLMLEACVVCPDRMALLQQYAVYLETIKDTSILVQVQGLPPIEVTIDYTWARLLYFHLCEADHLREIVQVLRGRLPLSPSEVVSAIHTSFRGLELSRHDRAGDDEPESPSSATNPA